MIISEQWIQETQDRQLVAIRILNASRLLVFDAWTQPEYLKQWWGPNGFTNTFEIFNPTNGGAWKFIMHGPNGVDYPNESLFIEVSPEKIIIQHLSKPHFHLIASFEKIETNKTRIIFRQVFETVSDCNKIKVYAENANEQNLDRLEKVLQQIQAKKELVLKRTYSTNAEKLFDAWTKEEELKKWWGPHGFTNPVCKAHTEPGGQLLIHMQSPDGMVFPLHGFFQQVKKPELVVFTSSAFEDENGTDQLQNLNTVEIKQVNGKAEMKLHVLVVRSNEAVDEALDGMKEGWNQSLDKLEKFLRGKF